MSINKDKPLPEYKRKDIRDNVKNMAEKIMDKKLTSDNMSGKDFYRDFNQLWEILREETRGELNNPRQAAYLAAYSILGAVSYSAKCAGVNPQTIYNWEKDDVFMEYYKKAEQAHTEYLEMEAQRRAVMGVEEDVFYQGEVVGQKTNYSDSLLKFLLKGKQPQKYGNTSKVEIKGDKNSKIQVNFGVPELNQDVDTSEIEEG